MRGKVAPANSMIGAASWLTPPRVDEPELLDLGLGSPEDVQASLADLWRINRFLGGLDSIARPLYNRLPTHSGTITCVDIGAGSAEVSTALVRGGQRRGYDIQMIAVDFARRNLELADSESIHRVQSDAFHLPLAANSVDYVISSLLLHHFKPEQVIDLLCSAATVARHGIIMSDLVRGWLPMAAFKVLQPIFARSTITRYDGMVSLRRAYTPAEMREMAATAGLSNCKIHVFHPWFRMTLTADKV